MLTLEEITEKQAIQIAELQREIISLKTEDKNEYHKKTISELQDALFLLHNRTSVMTY